MAWNKSGLVDPVGGCGIPAGQLANLANSCPKSHDFAAPPCLHHPSTATTGPMQARRLRHERGGFARFCAAGARPTPNFVPRWSTAAGLAQRRNAPGHSSTTGCHAKHSDTGNKGHRGINQAELGRARTTHNAPTEPRAGQPDLGFRYQMHRMQISRAEGNVESSNRVHNRGK